MPIHINLHSGVASAATWRTAGKSTAYLKKGELEASEIYYAACAALVVLGVATRSHIRILRVEPEGKLFEFYCRGLLTYGVRGYEDMAVLLSTIEHLIDTTSIRSRRKETIAFILRRLARGAVCLMQISPSNADSQWLLAVGVERMIDADGTRVLALLVLDAASDRPHITYWNGRLSIEPPFPDRRRLLYADGSGTICSVVIRSAFALTRKVP